MASLYNLTQEFINLMNSLAEEEGEEAALEAIEALQIDIGAKLTGYAYVIKELEGQAAVCRAEKERLAARESSSKNKIASLKQIMQDSMERLGVDDIKTDLFSFKIQANPPKLHKHSEENIDLFALQKAGKVRFRQGREVDPKDYYIPQPPKLDEARLKKDIQDGKLEVEGIEVLRGRSIRIR